MTKNLNIQSNNVPVGFIGTWHKTLTGTPTLPSDWQECDGTAITNTASPMYGENTPNMSSNAWVFGSTTSSNTPNTNAGPNHKHNYRATADGQDAFPGNATYNRLVSTNIDNPSGTAGSSFQMVFIIKVV